MKLELFKKLDDVPEDKLHPKFKFLRDVILGGEKNILTDWTEDFIDRDNKIIKEFQTTFHSSFWEFYLFKIFKDLGFEIDFNHDRPDFIINSPQDILIEAVVSNIKTGGREEGDRNIEDITSMLLPPHKQNDFNQLLDESIVRNSNAILGKSKKYLDKYIKCDWVSTETPFVIALSSYDQVNYGREYNYPLMALLYGRYFDPQLNRYESKDSIIKPETSSEIPIGLFNSSDNEHISAIIFSSTTTLGKLTSLDISRGNIRQTNAVLNIRNDYEEPYYKIQPVSNENPEELSDGLMIFHNPNSKKPLDINLFKNSNALQFIPTPEGMSIEGENTPIFSRINLPSPMINNILINQIFRDFNE